MVALARDSLNVPVSPAFGVVVTPGSTNLMTTLSDAGVTLYTRTAGTVVFETAGAGNQLTYVAVPAFTAIFPRAQRCLAGTTAEVIALY